MAPRSEDQGEGNSPEQPEDSSPRAPLLQDARHDDPGGRNVEATSAPSARPGEASAQSLGIRDESHIRESDTAGPADLPAQPQVGADEKEFSGNYSRSHKRRRAPMKERDLADYQTPDPAQGAPGAGAAIEGGQHGRLRESTVYRPEALSGAIPAAAHFSQPYHQPNISPRHYGSVVDSISQQIKSGLPTADSSYHTSGTYGPPKGDPSSTSSHSPVSTRPSDSSGAISNQPTQPGPGTDELDELAGGQLAQREQTQKNQLRLQIDRSSRGEGSLDEEKRPRAVPGFPPSHWREREASKVASSSSAASTLQDLRKKRIPYNDVRAKPVMRLADQTAATNMPGKSPVGTTSVEPVEPDHDQPSTKPSSTAKSSVLPVGRTTRFLRRHSLDISRQHFPSAATTGLESKKGESFRVTEDFLIPGSLVSVSDPSRSTAVKGHDNVSKGGKQNKKSQTSSLSATAKDNQATAGTAAPRPSDGGTSESKEDMRRGHGAPSRVSQSSIDARMASTSSLRSSESSEGVESSESKSVPTREEQKRLLLDRLMRYFHSLLNNAPTTVRGILPRKKDPQTGAVRLEAERSAEESTLDEARPQSKMAKADDEPESSVQHHGYGSGPVDEDLEDEEFDSSLQEEEAEEFPAEETLIKPAAVVSPDPTVINPPEKGEYKERASIKTACNNCQQRRIKCDMKEPACMQCTRSKRVCGSYAPAPGPVGRRMNLIVAKPPPPPPSSAVTFASMPFLSMQLPSAWIERLGGVEDPQSVPPPGAIMPSPGVIVPSAPRLPKNIRSVTDAFSSPSVLDRKRQSSARRRGDAVQPVGTNIPTESRKVVGTSKSREPAPPESRPGESSNEEVRKKSKKSREKVEARKPMTSKTASRSARSPEETSESIISEPLASRDDIDIFFDWHDVPPPSLELDLERRTSSREFEYLQIQPSRAPPQLSDGADGGSYKPSAGSSAMATGGASHAYSTDPVPGKSKRLPDDDGDDQAGSDEEERKAKKQKAEGEELARRLACPYFKHNPKRYQEERSCVGPGWRTVHRLKEHIYRCHALPIHCFRCHAIFKTDQEHQVHMRTNPPCEVTEERIQLEGFDSSQEKLLRSRKRMQRDITEEDKWRDVYHILFPADDPAAMPTPYYEIEPRPEDSTQTGTTSAERSELARYEQFLRQELPSCVRRELETRIEEALYPLEESLRGQLVDIARDLQLRLFQAYMATRKAEVQLLSPGSEPPHGADSVPSTEMRVTSASPGASSAGAASSDTPALPIPMPPSFDSQLGALPPAETYLDGGEFAGFDGLMFDFTHMQAPTFDFGDDDFTVVDPGYGASIGSAQPSTSGYTKGLVFGQGDPASRNSASIAQALDGIGEWEWEYLTQA